MMQGAPVVEKRDFFGSGPFIICRITHGLDSQERLPRVRRIHMIFKEEGRTAELHAVRRFSHGCRRDVYTIHAYPDQIVKVEAFQGDQLSSEYRFNRFGLSALMPRVYSLCRTVYKGPSAIQGITTLYMDRTKNVCGQWMREQTRTPPTEIKLFEIIKALKGTWILAKQLYLDLQFEVSSLHVDCVGFEDDPQQQVLLSLADPKRIGQNRKSIWVAGMKRWIYSFHLIAGTLYKTSPNPGTWYPF